MRAGVAYPGSVSRQTSRGRTASTLTIVTARLKEDGDPPGLGSGRQGWAEGQRYGRIRSPYLEL